MPINSGFIMKNIGNTLILPNRIDNHGRVSKYQRRNMRVVDMIPVDFQFLGNKLSNLKKLSSGDFDGKMLNYTYPKAIADFQKICEKYKIHHGQNYGGIRLWLTDETSANEGFTNNFTTNLIEQGINTLGSKFKTFQQIYKSFASKGSYNPLEQITELGVVDKQNKLKNFNTRFSGKELTAAQALDKKRLQSDIAAAKKARSESYSAAGVGFLNDLTSKLPVDVEGLVKGLVGVVGRGETISFPKIWDTSDYTPTLNLNIKLVSPYGSQKAIQKFIIEPLLFLLILVSPRSKNNVTISKPSPLRIKTYGVSNINYGAVKNIQIRRGGGDSTYNKYRQPLSLNLNLQIEPLYNGFASIQTSNPNDDVSIDDFADDVSHIIDDVRSSRSFTTLGDIIKSFRPFKQGVDHKNYQSGREYKPDGFFDKTKMKANEFYTKRDPLTVFADPKGEYTPSFEFTSSDSGSQVVSAADTANLLALQLNKTKNDGR